MPHLYIVEKKIKLHIIIISIIVVVIFVTLLTFFMYNYIQMKRLSSIYDYMAIGDYSNASFIFNDLYEKYPLDKNILKTGVDLYYDMLIRSDKKSTIISSSENIAKYGRQLLLIHPFVKKKHILYQRLALSYQKLGASYYPNSYDAYIKAIENGDNRITTTIDLARVCYEIGKYSDAIKYLEDSVKKESEISSGGAFNILLYYELANAYAANKDYTRAIQILSSLDGKPNNDIMLESKIYYRLGNLYFNQGLYKESEFFYKKALRIDGKNPDIYYSMGVLYRTMKKKIDAINMFREAVKIDNTYSAAKEALRRL